MGTVSIIAFYFGVVAYSASATLFFVDLARSERAPSAQRWAALALGVGAALHAMNLVAGVLDAVVAPLSLRFALSLCACSLSLAFLVQRRRARIDAIGVVVAP